MGCKEHWQEGIARETLLTSKCLHNITGCCTQTSEAVLKEGDGQTQIKAQRRNWLSQRESQMTSKVRRINEAKGKVRELLF